MAKSDVGRYEDLVYDLLVNYPMLRDNAVLLYISCVSEIRGERYVRKTTLKKFAEDALNPNTTKIPSMSSVIRLNTKVQKENEHLRGKNYGKRLRHAEDYKEDLGYGK